MHDLSFFRNNLAAMEQRLATRGFKLETDKFAELDTERRRAVTETEQLKALRNSESTEIAKLKQAGEDTSERQQKVREIADTIASLDEKLKLVDDTFRQLLAGVPNIPHESVPVGSSADDNVEVHKFGKPPQFDFEPKAHWDLGPDLKILDLERAAKVTGARFAVYIGLGA